MTGRARRRWLGTALGLAALMTWFGLPSAAATETMTAPVMLDGMGLYAFRSGDVVGRFCFDRADNNFASVFILLYDAGKSSVTVSPEDVVLYVDGESAERWEPSAYSKHLEHPRTWLGIATLLATPDGQIAALPASGAQYYTPAVVTTEHASRTATTSDRQKAVSFKVFGAKQADLFWAAVKTAPVRSEDMLLRSTTLVPGSAVFGAVPFRTKISDDAAYTVKLSFGDPALQTSVAPRE